MKSRADDQGLLDFANSSEPGVAPTPIAPKVLPAAAMPSEPARFPQVYSYPGIVSLNGNPVPERIVAIGDEWEFLFNGGSSSKQIGTVVLRPLHLRVLFAICSFAREQYRSVDDALDFFWMPPVFDTKWMFGPKDIFSFNCSMRQLWKRMGNAGTPSTANRKLVLGCLDDWKNSPIRVRPVKREAGNDGWTIRFIIHGWGEDCEVERNTPHGPIKEIQRGLTVSVSKNLLFLIERQYAQIHLDVFNNFTSDLARMTYLHYVPRAAGKKEWSKRLPAVYEELGLPCPKYASAQEEPFRRRWRSQKSVLDQLDGAATLRGVLHADIERCADGVPKLVLRVDEPDVDQTGDYEPGVLKQIWLDNDGTEIEWNARMKRRKTLRVKADDFDSDPYVAEKWESTGIGSIERFRDPIEMGIAVIGLDKFREIIGHIASDSKPPTKTRLHQLVYEIKEAVKHAPKA